MRERRCHLQQAEGLRATSGGGFLLRYELAGELRKWCCSVFVCRRDGRACYVPRQALGDDAKEMFLRKVFVVEQ